MTCKTISFVSRLIQKSFRQKFSDLFGDVFLTEYVLFTSFILITLLHNAVRKFGTFLLRHPVICIKRLRLMGDY